MRAPLWSLPLVLVGCAPTLFLTRPTPPEGDFGTVRTMPITVGTDVGRNVEQAVTAGLLMGEIPVPVSVDAMVKERFAARLQSLGYGVCPQAPCGDGELTIQLLESIVGTEFTSNGLRSNVRLRARVKVRQQDGQEPYDYTFWANRSGHVTAAPALVREAAEAMAAEFASTLMPGREQSELQLEDGGSLRQGVNMLLSSNWGGAISYFDQLVQREPDNAGAWYDLGVAWEAFGDWGQALSAYEQAAARDRKRAYLAAVEHARRRAPRGAPGPVQGPPPQPIPLQ
jgi:hypothetical protein